MAVIEIFLEECSYTRTRVAGHQGPINILPAQLLGAMFQHGTSRADDPQLHTHFLIFNVALTKTDDKWRAMRRNPLHKVLKIGDACYHAHLAKILVDHGMEVERYGEENTYVRVKHIPKELEKLWSKRRSQIVQAAAQQTSHRPHPGETSDILPVESFHPKHPRHDPELRHIRWRRECDELFDSARLVDFFRSRLDQKANS